MSALPLRIRETEHRVPVIELAGTDLAPYLTPTGLQIEYVVPARLGGPSFPQVTLTFGPGKVALDFDVALLERLLDAASGAGA